MKSKSQQDINGRKNDGGPLGWYPSQSNSGIYNCRYIPFQRAATGGVKQHHFPYMNQTKSSFKDHEVQKLRLCHKASLIGRFCGSRADLGTCGCPWKDAANAAFPTGAAQVLDGAKPSSPTGPPKDLLPFFKVAHFAQAIFLSGNAFGRLR